MDDLPSPILVEILSRLSDSTDLARCRLASRTLRALSYDVRRVALCCSRSRFLRSRSPETRDAVVPFRSLVANLLSLLSPVLDSLSIGVERHSPDDGWGDDEFDDSDDLHLTAVDFLARWMPGVGGRLRSLVISDYWIQSCWRRSEALAVISDCCCSLLNLEVRNAWLSVDRLKPMLKLTTLTLEFIRLDDEDLDKVNGCFPSLQVLNLIGVGGLKEPKILLSELRICNWTVSNFPLSLTVDAPNLVELNLRCIEPKVLVLKTPLLSHLNLLIEKPTGAIKMEKFSNLNSLKLVSSDLQSLLQVFSGSKTVKKLELAAPEYMKSVELLKIISFGDLMTAFPNIDDLSLGPGAWYQLEGSFDCSSFGTPCECVLKKLTVDLPSVVTDVSFISFMLNLCTSSCGVTIFFHVDMCVASRKRLMSRFATNFPKVRWRWGMRNNSNEDTFLNCRMENEE